MPQIRVRCLAGRRRGSGGGRQRGAQRRVPISRHRFAVPQRGGRRPGDAGAADNGVDRDDVFITTKLGNPDQGYDTTLRAFDASASRLGIDVVDLYLIHWPRPKADLYVDTWRAMIRLRDEGRVTTIGVSNFEPEHLDRLMAETGETPAINQVEFHPYFQQRAFGITTQNTGSSPRHGRRWGRTGPGCWRILAWWRSRSARASPRRRRSWRGTWPAASS